eukprot:4173626-Pleurochrysis_carterae.AAC.1
MSAIAEAEATAEACVSITRINAQEAIAGKCESQLGKMVMKTASSSMHRICMCARTDAAASTHDVVTIVAKSAGVRSGVVS